MPAGLAVVVPSASAAPTLYVSLSGAGIAQYSIALNGRLLPKQPARVGPVVGDIGGIGVLPDGSSAYAANTFAGLGPVVKQDTRLWQYNVAAASGVLRLKRPRSVTTGRGPSRVVVAPNGRSVYVVDVFADTISQFTVQPGTGRLTPKRPAAVRAENNPAGIAVAPNGKFVYVANLQQQDHADDQQQPPVRVAGLIAEDLFQRASHAITTSSEPCSPIHRQNSVNQIEFRNTATTARTVCHGSGSSRGPCLRRPPRSSANT